MALLFFGAAWQGRPAPIVCLPYPSHTSCGACVSLLKAPKLTFLYFLFILPLAFYRGAHRDGGHGTSYSEKYFDGNRPAAMYNKNVEWLRYAHFWWLYLGFVAFFVTLLRLTILSKAEDLGMVLTVAHVVHNLVSDREMGGGREGEREG